MNKRRSGMLLAILFGLYFAGLTTTIQRPCTTTVSVDISLAGCVEIVGVGDDPSILFDDLRIAREFIIKLLFVSTIGVLLVYVATRDS